MTIYTMNKDICNNYCFRNNIGKKQVTKNYPDKIELIAFDMDGVLADTISSWKYVHDYFGCSNDRSVDEYLKGKIDDNEFIKRDVSLWQENSIPTTKDKIIKILSNVKLIKGADKCIKELKRLGISSAIVSAGLDILAKRLGAKLGIDYIFANEISTDKNGRLNGDSLIKVRLMHKDKTIINLSDISGISIDNIAAVGNSCFDIPMFETCGLGIAFNPNDDCIKNVADIVVEGKDLSRIIDFISKYLQ